MTRRWSGAAVRRTAIRAAVAVAALTALTASAVVPASAAGPAGSSVATQQPDPTEWMGPFYTSWHCNVVLALRGDDGPCQFNPSPPTTTWGWWYRLDKEDGR